MTAPTGSGYYWATDKQDGDRHIILLRQWNGSLAAFCIGENYPTGLSQFIDFNGPLREKSKAEQFYGDVHSVGISFSDQQAAELKLLAERSEVEAARRMIESWKSDDAERVAAEKGSHEQCIAGIKDPDGTTEETIVR